MLRFVTLADFLHQYDVSSDVSRIFLGLHIRENILNDVVHNRSMTTD